MAQARIDREQMRSQTKETLLGIINNENLSEEERQNAVQSMVEMTDAIEKEAAAELLLEAKGFDNVVVNLTGETVDVLVPSTDLGDDQRAQIEDIITRKTGVEVQNIVITPMMANSEPIESEAKARRRAPLHAGLSAAQKPSRSRSRMWSIMYQSVS